MRRFWGNDSGDASFALVGGRGCGAGRRADGLVGAGWGLGRTVRAEYDAELGDGTTRERRAGADEVRANAARVRAGLYVRLEDLAAGREDRRPGSHDRRKAGVPDYEREVHARVAAAAATRGDLSPR